MKINLTLNGKRIEEEIRADLLLILCGSMDALV